MKKLSLVFLFFTVAGISVVYYYWQQATQLPEWYTTQSWNTSRTQEFSNTSEIRNAEARLQAKIAASIAKSDTGSEESPLPLTTPTNLPINEAPVLGEINKANESSLMPSGETIPNTQFPIPNSQEQGFSNYSNQDNSNLRDRQISKRKNVEIELSNQEVNELVMSTIAKHIDNGKVTASIPTFNTTIKEGKLESGTVINLAKIPKEQLSEREAAFLEKVQNKFPFLKNQKIYVAISGQPRIENGQLKLDNNPQIKMGNLSLSVSELSQRLNIPQEKLEQKLKTSLELGKLKVNDMDLADNKVKLRGSVEQ